jgi:hypothetical protein
MKLSTEHSLKKLGEMLNVADRTGGLIKEFAMPYLHFTSMERVEGRDVPPLGAPEWAAMRDGSSMITADEHAGISAEVAAGGWWSVLGQYLKNVSPSLHSHLF